MTEEIITTKIAFFRKKEIRKIIDSTHGMWGDLQAVTNRSLPSIKSLEITEGNSTEQNLS